MDQDSFRQLISQPSTSRTSSAFKSKPKKSISASEPAFKPRKVKKSDGKYRDRAAERRTGEGNDYAQVEAVLEDFEKRTANQDKDEVDKQRAFLGGDSEHTVLVKGLDMALVEQNRVKASLGTDDDDALEQVFQEITVPKPRARDDIIRELRESRLKAGAAAPSALPVATESKITNNKFKPIGFKPIGEKDGQKKKKKKKKVVDGKPSVSEDNVASSSKPTPAPEPSPSVVAVAEPEPDDFDIFEGAGDYEGLGDDDDDDDDETGNDRKLMPPPPVKPTLDEPSRKGKGWFGGDDPEPAAVIAPPSPPPVEDGEVEEEEAVPVKLTPLASSSIPSIKDILAMDDAANALDKKRKRKDKKKAGAGTGEKAQISAEDRAERDYKRLKTYTDKRGA